MLKYNLAAVEKKTIIAALEFYDGNRTKTAVVLGISIRTLRTKLIQYDMKGYLIKYGRTEPVPDE